MKWKITLLLCILLPVAVLSYRFIFGPGSIRLFAGSDKLLHLFFSAFISYAVLSILKNRSWNLPITPIILAVVFTLEEISQRFYPWRSFEILDLLVNQAGVAIAVIIFYIRSNSDQ